MYKREQMLQKRKKSAGVTGVYAAINPENQYIDYRTGSFRPGRNLVNLTSFNSGGNF